MKKIAFVSNNIPLPEDMNGNTSSIINILRGLKKIGYEIDYYVFSENINRDKLQEETFKKEVNLIVWKKRISKYLFFLNFFRRKIHLDCPVLVSSFNVAYYYPLIDAPKKVLFAADSTAFLYSKQSGLKAKLFYNKLLIEESFIYKKFEKVIFVSPFDLEFTKLKDKNGIYFPIGCNISSSFENDNHDKEYDVTFSGSYDYPPNVDAFNYFVSDIFPHLLKMKPDIKVCFVGRRPTQEMIDYANTYKDNIIVTGEVDSIYPFLYKTKIYVSPLRLGSGMKNKILQAMMTKLPIICTSESITGVTNYDETAVFVRNTAEDIVSAIKGLLLLPVNELQQLGELNYKSFINHYTWDSVVSNYYGPLIEKL